MLMETDDNNISVRVASFSCYLDTAKENLVNRSVNSSHQESPPILFNSVPKTTKPTSNFSNSSKENLRVDSFSYLNTAGENFFFKIPVENINPVHKQDPNSAAFSFCNEIPKNDTEISVFGADKYFNMKFEYKQPHMIKKEWPVNLPRAGSNNGQRKPSLCSEASTALNSQTPLLVIPNLERIRSKKGGKTALGRRIFGGFGCRGPCFESKDVQMEKIVAPCHGSNPTVTKHMIKAEDLEEDARKSIEVFGSTGTLTSKGDVAKAMERKLSVLTWDAIPKGEEKTRPPPPSKVGSSTIVCDDMASDASSDLFEIEHISGSLFPLLNAEGTDDRMSSCMSPQSHYAPSEASIQWSVVTASAADYSSVLSDNYNDETSVSVAGDATARNITRNGSAGQKSRGGAGLLGCKSYKAVDVVAESHVICKINNQKGKALIEKSQASKYN